VGAHGTFTLPSHIAMFHSGTFPCDNRKSVKIPFNRKKRRIFKAQLQWNRTYRAMFPTPPAENIIKGFEKLGYRTIGLGGVSWFNNKFEPSKIWRKYYFQEFYWNEKFSENNFKSIDHQIAQLKKLNLPEEKRPTFLFINISMTHKPYLGFGTSKKGQMLALEEFDKKIPSLFKHLPDSFHFLILSDHGECFGENGLWGHSIYHPKVMEIPFNYAYISKKAKM
jgi:hypothetical protein